MITTKILQENKAEIDLLKVKVPEATDSYTPIPHSLMIQTTLDELNKRKLKVINKSYQVNNKGNGVIGHYGIKSDDSELGMMIAFRNSYDKSMSAAYVGGAQVWICGNGCISGDMKIVRKHTGNADEEVLIKLVSCIDYLEENFNKIKADRDLLKNIEINKKVMAELCGRMYIDNEIINSVQLNIIKREIEKPTFKYTEAGNTYWDFYNFVTYSLKTTAPGYYVKKHIDTHNFLMEQIL